MMVIWIFFFEDKFWYIPHKQNYKDLPLRLLWLYSIVHGLYQFLQNMCHFLAIQSDSACNI